VGKNATGTFRKFEVAFIEQPVGRTQVFDWYSKFKGSVTYVEDAECLECPLTSKTDDSGFGEGACPQKQIACPRSC
jgi:hypothetical protein